MAHGESGIFTSQIPMGMNSASRNFSRRQQQKSLGSAQRIIAASFNTKRIIINTEKLVSLKTHTQIGLCGAVQAGGGPDRDFCVTWLRTHSILLSLRTYPMSGQTAAPGGP